MTNKAPPSGEQQSRRCENSNGCFRVLNDHPVACVLTFAAMGLATGIGFSFWSPEDETDASHKANALKWIGLLGDLFIRSLTAVVLPMVFVTVAISMVDMINAGKASTIGWKTIGLYTMTTVIASIEGVISIIIFSRFFQTNDISDDTFEPPVISLGCSSGGLLAEAPDGSVFCTSNYVGVESTNFVLYDVNGTLATTNGGVQDDISLSDTMYEGVFLKLVTNNIILSFSEANFAAVVFFAICFGTALAVHISEETVKYATGGMTLTPIHTLLNVLKEIEAIFVRLLTWIIAISPFAVFSLIAAAVGAQNDIAKELSNVAWLLLAQIAAFVVHFLVVDVGLLAVFTKSNPFDYLKFMIPAQTTAFAVAISAATLPVTMNCVEESNMVADPVRKFVLPLGATLNMDGDAIYIPCACIWLAVLNGITPNIGQYVLLVILSTIGSAGAAPVPASELVVILTVYNTVFNTIGTPDGFEFIVAVAWFADRVMCMLNITGDSVVARIVTATIHDLPLSSDHYIANGKEFDDDSSTDNDSAGKHITFLPTECTKDEGALSNV